MGSHAYFKAILFMCAGIVIHNMKDYQDLRSMGRINCNIPTVSGLINVANLRLCGLPFIRGFYSKDSILEALFISETNLIFFILVLLATGLTVSYSCRLSLCLSSFRLKLERIYSTTEIDKYMLFGIYILLPFSIMGGYNLIWQITSFNQFVYLPFWIKLIFCPRCDLCRYYLGVPQPFYHSGTVRRLLKTLNSAELKSSFLSIFIKK